MYLRSRFPVVCLLVSACCPLFGAAQLRLEYAALGPFSVAAGSNGTTQTVNALNAGDGQLNLQATSSVPWLTPSVGAVRSCGALGNCTPVGIALNTAALAKGMYTGVVTVSDPNAVDAPQNITVTVAVGGGVPDALTLYVPDNGTPVSSTFSTGGRVSPTVTSPSGGPVLSVALPSAGSFASTFSYTLTAKANPGTADGTYNGSVALSGSPLAAENKTIPVTLNVTAQPIVQFTTPPVLRVAQGATKQTQYLVSTNQGAGTLTLSTATAATTSGGNWLTTSIVGPYVGLTADPTGLAPGTYQGTVTLASNAANTGQVIPVTLQVVAAGPPLIYYQGVKSNATFLPDILAQGDLPAVFGEQFTTGNQMVAPAAPWPTTLGGATVFINNLAVPIYYVSQTQINFQVPYEIPAGPATLRVDRDGQRGNSVSVTIAKASPKLLVATNVAGAVVSSPLRDLGNGVTLGGAAVAVQAGDYVTIYSLGFGAATPAVATAQAAPASPLSVVSGSNKVYFGAGGLFSKPVSTVPQFVGLSPNYVGLYQVNVQIPTNAPKGAAVQVFVQGDAGTSNTLLFNIQ